MQNNKPRSFQPTLFDNPPLDEPQQLLPLDQYDIIALGYSGGKDSLACLLHLLELGVPPSKIELHHHDIDGEGERLMDWPCTRPYAEATAQALGIPLVLSWREGGFVREMLRDHSPTAPVVYEKDGGRISLPTVRASEGTRRKFPQQSADLNVRWCSAYLKIDVMARVLNNDPAYQGKKVLVVTGERREESSARSRYDEADEHRCNSKNRTVHQWRPVIDWTEQQVWDIIARHRVRPHPAYSLGYGRVSCMNCIFADEDQWASNQVLAPTWVARIGGYEREFGTTIKKGTTVEEMARRGKEFVSDKPEELRRLAMSPDAFTTEMFFLADGELWTPPAGAYKRCGGPI